MDSKPLTPQDIFINIVRYEVPAFQRRYIWTQENQWEPLWEDLRDQAETVLESGQANRHFMGAVVLQQRPNPTSSIGTRIVVDGQQRLTTLQLLMDAVQEVFVQQGYEQPAARLEPLVLNPQAYLGGNNPDLAFKVWPTINDQAAFRQAMRNDLQSEEYRNSRIISAHDYFKTMAEQWLQKYPVGEGQRDKAADALDRAVREFFELVVIDLNQADDPHIIFETLNARGTPLLPSDMIKNQILYQAGINSDDAEEPLPKEAEQLWRFNEDWWGQEIGSGRQRRPRIDIFLNNWLTLRNQRETKAHDEFSVFSEYVDRKGQEGTSIQSIAADIGRLGDIYRDIDQLRMPEIEPFLYRRQVMGIGVVIPVLLWLLSSEVPKSQLSKSITALESYMVRRMACGLSARAYGTLFAGLLAELQESGPENAGDVSVRYLAQQTAGANLWPDDQSLLDTFVTAPLYWSLTRGRLNLILQGIEGGMRTALSETQSVQRNLHIEHIMPQGWHLHWPLPSECEDEERTSEARDRFIHSIGNLTLVNQRLNSALSNAPWEEKQKTLSDHSVLFLNKALLNDAPHIWDETAIAERARQLHRAAVKVWPHANAMR